jgi:hypothetical protein
MCVCAVFCEVCNPKILGYVITNLKYYSQIIKKVIDSLLYNMIK